MPGQNKAHDSIEDFIQLEDYVSFVNLKGSPGAALLYDGQTHKFRFGFQADGIHPTLSDKEMTSILSFIEAGVKAMPNGETINIIQDVRTDSKNRLNYYRWLHQNAVNPVFKEMVRSAASSAEYFPNLDPKDITNRARLRYKAKKINIYVTCTPSKQANVKDKTDRVVSKVVDAFSNIWFQLTGEEQIQSRLKLKEFFLTTQSIYEDWLNILGQMRLSASPMSVDDLVRDQWSEFNETPIRSLPQLMIWDGDNIHYSLKKNLHISSWFFEKQQNVPKAARDWVYQRTENRGLKFTGVLTLRNKPSGWKRSDQLHYLYKKADFLDEYKIIFTATKAPEFAVRRKVELIQRQAKDATSLAEKRGLPSTTSERLQDEARKAVLELADGNIPIKTSLCFLVTKRDKGDLVLACRKLQSQFLLPAELEIESDYTYTTWLQCFPQLSYHSPLFSPYDRTKEFMSSSVPAFMPIVKVTSPDQEGLEFVTEEEGTPYYLDIAKIHRHILFLATTRSGKSVLFAQILMIAMCSKIPMVIVDYPRETGDSTFGPITRLAGNEGAYLNIAEESNNILELPDLRRFDEDEKQRRMIEVKDYVLDTLMIVMYGGSATQDDREKRTCKSIFGNLIHIFYEDEGIKARFEAAIGKPIGSPEWQNTPTLVDFTGLCSESILASILETVSPEHVQLMNEIKLRLRSFMQTTVGRSMSTPTTIPPQANLLVFAFKGVSNNEDAAILMSSAAAAAMRRTLSAPVSILFLDEASILSKFESLMAQTAKIAANGAKSGIRLMMALQTPASIAKSESGDEILANMTTRIIGRVDAGDALNYSKILKIPEDVIYVNTVKSFYPVAAELYSRWLIIDKGVYTFVRSYAPPLLLAAVANNPKEEQAKAAFLERYGDPVIALKKFAVELILSFQENRPIKVPETETIKEVGEYAIS